MTEDIFKRQNKEDILELLFAQRKSYDRAEAYNKVGWIMTLLLLLQGVCELFIPFLDQYSLIVNAFIAIFIYIADWKCGENIQLGARSKNLIDCILFGFEVNQCTKEKLTNYALTVKEKNKEEYLIQITHDGTGEIKGVKNWYTPFDSDNYKEIIFKCQNENLWWNEELVCYYKKVLGICIIFFAVVGLSSSHFMGIGITLLIMIGTVSIKFIDAFKKMRTYLKIMDRANGKKDLINENHLDISALLSLQEEIDAIRTSGFLVPNWVHSLYADKLHNRRKELNKRINE